MLEGLLGEQQEEEGRFYVLGLERQKVRSRCEGEPQAEVEHYRAQLLQEYVPKRLVAERASVPLER